MKRILKVLIVLLLINLFSCSTNKEENKEEEIIDDKLTIVTTIFPIYDWTKEIIKGNQDIELIYLLDNGLDLHNYQASAQDIIKINNCDLFIYVGGESDEWVEDALANKTNKDMVVINLLDVLGDSVKEEEGPEYDEHVWLSVKSSSIICSKIAEELEKADPDNKSIYEANAKEYIAKLDELDNKYQEVVSGAKFDTVLFGDRFPFRYLVDDYNLDYFAAFVGCSAESEASFETITFLADKVDELGLKSILQIETSDGKIANTIKDNTKSKDQQILTMDSMQSVTADELQSGVTYISVMESNLEVLKSALN